MNAKLLACLAVFSFIAAANVAHAAERCFDDLGHRIPGACSDDQAAPNQPVDTATDDGAHSGFFLRMTLGGGATNFTTDDDVKIGKGGGNFDIQIGGAPVNDFAVYGFMLANSIVGPTLEANGQRVETSNDISFNTQVVGAGLTYYFPWNVYAEAGAGVAILSLAYDDSLTGDRATVDTDPGFAVVVGGGKEWMVSEHWGLGAALKAVVSKVRDREDGNDVDYTGVSVLAAFSATFF